MSQSPQEHGATEGSERPVLDPRIAAQLDAFARQRRHLLLLRSTAIAACAGVGSVIAIAGADHFVVMGDRLRIVLGVGAWAAIAGGAWWGGMGKLMRGADRRRLAHWFERECPDLHEQILAAIDLAEGDPRLDSPQLRAAMQAVVGERVSTVDVSKLLPLTRIRPVLRAASGGALLTFVLCVIPGLGFGRLALRALIPFADIERPSQTGIHLLSPDPGEGVVPLGDTLVVAVELSGAETDAITLETDSGDDRSRVAMVHQGGRRWAVELPVTRPELRYRIRAGDGLTRYRTLVAQPRPQVVRFLKSYLAPEYTASPAREVDDTVGDLAGLVGSTVELRIQIDQPVSESELRLHLSDGDEVVPLHQIDEHTLGGTLRLDRPGTYRVHLVAKRSGFANSFSPDYELRPTPDLPPSAAIASPKADLVVGADELMSLVGSAQDDVGLAQIEQQIRINQGEWTVVQRIAATGERTVPVRLAWDLLPIKANTGDLILTRLVAIDRKGNRGESTQVAVTISAKGVDPTRRALILALRHAELSSGRITDACDDLALAVDAASESAHDQAAANDSRIGQATVGILGAADRTGRIISAAIQGLHGDLRSTLPPGGDADLLRLARAWSQIQRRQVGPLREADPEEDDRADLRTFVTTAKAGSREATAVAAIAAKASSAFLAAAKAQTVLLDLVRLSHELASTQPEADLDIAAERDRRHIAVVAKQCVAIETDLMDLDAQVDGLASGLAADLAKVRSTATEVQANLGAFAGSYFPRPDFQGEPISRADAKIDFNWGNDAPLKGIPSDNFSVRWTGSIRIPSDGRWTLATVADDGTRLWIDDRLVIDDWQVHGMIRVQTEIDLTAGYHTLRLEYFEAGGGAGVQLRWSGPGVPDAPLTAVSSGTQAVMQTGLEKTIAGWRPLADGLARRAEQARRALDAVIDIPLTIPSDDPMAQAVALRQASAELRDRAAIEEQRANGGDRFAKQLTQAAEALDAGTRRHAATDAAQVQQAANVLAEAQRLAEAQTSATLLARDTTSDPDLLRDGIRRLNGELAALAATLPATAGRELQAAREALAAPELESALAERSTGTDATIPALERAQAALARATKADADRREQAESLLQAAAPTLADRLDHLAEDGQDLASRSTELAVSSAEPAEIRRRAEALARDQERWDEHLESARTALRQDANDQDLAQREGRERARDADNALAMLAQPPPRARDLLAAAAAADPEERADRLNAAAEQQLKTSIELEQLADHYRSLAAQGPPAAREELRAKEAELGLTPSLDERYQRAERLAEAADASKGAEHQQRALERELAANPAMRAALRQTAQEQAAAAAEQLQHAAVAQAALNRDHQDPERIRAALAQDLAREAHAISAEAQQLAADTAPTAASREQAAAAIDQAAKQLAALAASPQAGQESETLRQAAAALTQTQQELAAPSTVAETTNADSETKADTGADTPMTALAARADELAKAATAVTNGQAAAEVERRIGASVTAARERQKQAARALAQTGHGQEAQAMQAAAQTTANATSPVEEALSGLTTAPDAPTEATEQAMKEALSALAASATHAAQAAELAGKPSTDEEVAPPAADTQASTSAKTTDASPAGDTTKTGDHETTPVDLASETPAKFADQESASGPDSTASKSDRGDSTALDGEANQDSATKTLAQALADLATTNNPTNTSVALPNGDQPMSSAQADAVATSARSPVGDPAANISSEQALAQALAALDAMTSAATAPSAQSPTTAPDQAAAQPSAAGPAQAQATAAATAALAVEARAMAASRKDTSSGTAAMPPGGLPPGAAGSSSGMAPMQGDAGTAARNGQAAAAPPGAEWDALRARDATGMAEGRHEAIANEYRNAVETYFQVIGERAKDQP